jgi:hypothetical protein
LIFLLPVGYRGGDTMKVKAGDFVIARFPFAEGDGRYKVRPALVIGTARGEAGQEYALLAGKYSATDKVRGEVEVVLTRSEAIAVGQDKEGVIRFDRRNLAVVPADDVLSVTGDWDQLPPPKKESLQRAIARLKGR